VDLIADNVDCVIRGGELTEQSLVARRIGNIDFVTVASPAYLARHGTPAHPTELAHQHTMVSFFSSRTGRQYTHSFECNGESHEITGRYQLAVNESNALSEAALAGLGIVALTRFDVKPHIESGALVQILPDWKRRTLPFYVVYPPNRHLSAKVRAFVDWAAELFAQNPYMQVR
jgi:DNA-binding transcriptional LysR family regulator